MLIISLMESMTLDVEPSQSKPKKLTVLNSRQSKFLASYQLTGNATESAINAGYPATSARVEGYRLLRNPKIVAELSTWKDNKLKTQLSKEDYIDKAMQTFEKLDITEPNSPRFYDIAGKALGYIGNNSTPSVTNNTQINIKGDIIAMNPGAKWDTLRGLLESE